VVVSLKYAFALITIVAILSLANAFSPSGPIVEGSFILGDDVNITVQAPRNSINRLTLTTPSGDVLGLMHNTKGSFSILYTPREQGTYIAASEFLELSTTMEANFTIIPGEEEASNESNLTTLNSSLTTDKSNYTLGENVSITSTISDSILSTLLLTTPSGEMLSLLNNNSVSFSGAGIDTFVSFPYINSGISSGGKVVV